MYRGGGNLHNSVYILLSYNKEQKCKIDPCHLSELKVANLSPKLSIFNFENNQVNE